MELVGVLWSRPIHDSRMAAIMLLQFFPKLLGLDDLDTVESMIRGSRTWAYVDDLAGHIAGNLVIATRSHPAWLDRWAVDVNFWIRRSALLATDRIAQARRAVRQVRQVRRLDARRKGVLHPQGDRMGAPGDQQTAARRGLRVGAPSGSRASGVTLREAVKYLSPAQRSAILEASGRKPR